LFSLAAKIFPQTFSKKSLGCETVFKQDFAGSKNQEL